MAHNMEPIYHPLLFLNFISILRIYWIVHGLRT